jgi:hypothetical protein
LHDAIVSERQGTPALAVVTTRFVSAAELMGRVLGAPDYKFAVIRHPISSAGDEQLAEEARTTLAQVRKLLLHP